MPPEQHRIRWRRPIMTLEVVSFVFGAVLVCIAVFGGGFELRELKVPVVAGAARAFAFLGGAFFIGLGIALSDSVAGGADRSRGSVPAPTIAEVAEVGEVGEGAPPQRGVPGIVQVDGPGGVVTPITDPPPTRQAPRLMLSGALTDGADVVHTVILEADVPVRFTGTCDRDCSDLDLVLFDEDGNEVAADRLYDNLPMVTVTPRWTGQFHVRVVMARCHVEPCAYAVELT
jgi:hypothetical protein